ncbi:MAG: radical SAM protein [Methanotrichaceae archaeon]|nr:radical SAM protein [Methanotrichaceae archaeon]
MIMKPFDPWKNSMCTCPPKLSLNPYTGCQHGCLYCYASAYIPNFQKCRPKQNLLNRLRTDVSKIDPGTFVSMSNSSDPYPPLEDKLELTRSCLEILSKRGFRVQVVTKSDLVCRDMDLLKGMSSTVSITITTMSDDLARRLEPLAPVSSRRLKAVGLLSSQGVPVSIRVDPVIPGINDLETEDLIKAISRTGARHVISSTYKAKSDSLKRLEAEFPKETLVLRQMLKRGERIGGSLYLPRAVREKLIQEVKNMVLAEGLTFSTCREGWPTEPGVTCDGSHILSPKRTIG